MLSPIKRGGEAEVTARSMALPSTLWRMPDPSLSTLRSSGNEYYLR